MATRTEISRCVIYARISLDDAKNKVNIAMHLAECRDYAEREGWKVAATFPDNNVSASKYSKKPRLEYQRMFEWLEADTDPSPLALLTTEMERLYRRVDELLPLIKLAEGHSLARIQCTNDDVYDLSTANGIHQAIGAVNNSARESAKLSERLRRKHQANLTDGAWHGDVPFGYRRVPITDEDGRSLKKGVRLEIVPEKAALLREAAERILAGESLRSICRDWMKRPVPVPSPRGVGYWVPSNLARMLQAPSRAGERVLRTGSHVRGSWEPILDPDTWELVQAYLGDPKRRLAKTSVRTRLLSGFVVCGNCGKRMYGAYHDTRDSRPGARRYYATYRCQPLVQGGCGRVSRKGVPLEEHVRNTVFHWLDSGAYDQALKKASGEDVANRELREKRTHLEAELSRAYRDYRNEELTAKLWAKIDADVQAELKLIDDELQRRQAKRTLAATVERGANLRAAWETWELDKRRALIAALVDRVVIHPLEPGTPNKAFDARRVEIFPGPWAAALEPGVLTLPEPPAGSLVGQPLYEAILDYLKQHPGAEVSPKGMAEVFGLPFARVWRVMQSLERRGLLTRTTKWAPGPGHPSLFRVA